MKRKTLALSCFIPVVVVFFLLWLAWPTLNLMFLIEPWSMRKARFNRAATRAEPLVAAITRYSSVHGHPPQNLTELVPEYIRKVPGTGLREYPEFKYLSFTNKEISLVWYDLGSRHGLPATGLWVYPDGDPEHAIVAFTLDKDGRVLDASLDRMPANANAVDFDAELWLAKSNRIEMVRDLPNQKTIPGMTLGEMEALLGSPDGRRLLRDSPWELRIDCYWGSFDCFFYWPTTNYPKYIYSGSTEQIGGWAYVHE